MSFESVIHLHDLEFDIRLGWLEEERKQLQQVMVDFKLLFSKPPDACQTDSLEDTICYARLIEGIKQELAVKEFKLIEHVSLRIYHLLKKNCLPNEVFAAVRVTKKIPLPDFKGFASFSYADEKCPW